jgi:phosphatidylserine/phosphatidylglycerophosphate/cardiolipin synthase-like enzyme
MRHRTIFSLNLQQRLVATIFLSLVFFSHVAPVLAGEWRVYFSPNGGATAAIVQVLSHAQHSVYVEAYSFTSAPIAKALVQAHKRGVDVEVILDKSNMTKRYSAVDFLLHAGIPTYIDSAYAIAHNKVMIVDEKIVITGSFNFTKSAETMNAENLLVIDDQELAARYLENWRMHEEHSEKYQGRTRPGNEAGFGRRPGLTR